MITAIILAKDEEKNISKCISFLRWTDEVIVIDDNSLDNTRKIARNSGAKVYKRSLDGDFASQRNFGLTKAKGDWVIFVDADEFVSPKMAHEIEDAIKKGICDYYFVLRRDTFLGKAMLGGDWGRTKLLRIGKKHAGKWERAVHEIWRVNVKVGQIHTPLLHFPFENLGEFVNNVNKYSLLHSKCNEKEGKKAIFAKILIMPAAKFLTNFCLKRGYRDGTHGFVYSVMMSFHSFLAWSQQWINSQNQKSKIY